MYWLLVPKLCKCYRLTVFPNLDFYAKKTNDIDWIIKNHSAYFAKFNLNETKIREHYEVWKVGKISTAVNDYSFAGESPARDSP